MGCADLIAKPGDLIVNSVPPFHTQNRFACQILLINGVECGQAMIGLNDKVQGLTQQDDAGELGIVQSFGKQQHIVSTIG